MKKRKKITGFLITATLIFTLCGTAFAAETEEQAEEDETEDVTVTYEGMKFSLPGDWLYSGDDSTMSFMSPDNEAMILLQSVDLSLSDDEYDDEALDVLFEASFEAIQAQYSEFQEESTEDLTVAGCEAKEMKATVAFGNTQMSDDALVIYDEDGQYFYMIQYVVKSEVEENTSAYENFLDSIEVNPYDDNLTIIDEVQSEDGYDITYQKYYFYENSLGDIDLNALVQIKNTGSENLQLRRGSFSISDEEGNIVDVVYYAKTDPDIVPPGEYGYIYKNSSSIDGDVSLDEDYIVTPEISVKETDREPVIYEVSDDTIFAGEYDEADVSGIVKNITDKDKSMLWIAIVLFDEDENPLGVYGTNANNKAPGATAFYFEADAIDLRDAEFSFKDVDNYEIIAIK